MIGIVSTNAQTPKSEFHKTIGNINSILKANHLAYYMSNKQYDAYIAKISATKQGIVSFTDSIPSIPEPEILAKKRPVLISDCCPRKNSRTLDLFAVKKWEIRFPYAYLKDKNNETFAKFFGFKKLDLDKLKEQFDKLNTLCKTKKLNNNKLKKHEKLKSQII